MARHHCNRFILYFIAEIYNQEISYGTGFLLGLYDATPRMAWLSYGFYTGEQVIDTVTLAPNLVIANQSLGAALETEGFDGVDGLLG